MKLLSKITALLLLLAAVTPLRADEGMWLINLLDKNLTAKMKMAGLKLDPRLIYDESAATLSVLLLLSILDVQAVSSLKRDCLLLTTTVHTAISIL